MMIKLKIQTDQKKPLKVILRFNNSQNNNNKVIQINKII